MWWLFGYSWVEVAFFCLVPRRDRFGWKWFIDSISLGNVADRRRMQKCQVDRELIHQKKVNRGSCFCHWKRSLQTRLGNYPESLSRAPINQRVRFCWKQRNSVDCTTLSPLSRWHGDLGFCTITLANGGISLFACSVAAVSPPWKCDTGCSCVCGEFKASF